MLKAINLVMLILVCGSVAAEPLGTGFTYQGELRDGGAPANGVYDLQFELYDIESGGAIIGSAVLVDNVTVDNGVFSVELDFGAGPYAGDQLWLEVGVRAGTSSGGFTGLLPRQKLTAAPYALHAEMIATNAVSGAQIVNGSVRAADIGPNSVGTSEIIASQVQRRLSGSCAEGTNLESVNEDGSIVCVDDEHNHVGEVWFEGLANNRLLSLTNTSADATGGFRATTNGGTGITGGYQPSDGTSGIGIHGYANGPGVGLSGYSQFGLGLRAESFAGTNIIEAYDGGPTSDNLRFRVSLGGNVFADGSFTGGGADVAEFIDSEDLLVPGDVVEIGPNGEFQKVREAGSTSVAGVITTHPGLLMNATESRQTLADGPALALVGRVPVKVTDQGGAVRPGDLLIASSIPGHAMRAPSNPLPGTVIGKSMDKHDAGEGEVEMLVMLR